MKTLHPITTTLGSRQGENYIRLPRKLGGNFLNVGEVKFQQCETSENLLKYAELIMEV